jgi:hypothetical protein
MARPLAAVPYPAAFSTLFLDSMDRFLKHIDVRKASIRSTISKLKDELQKLEYSEQVYRESGAVTNLTGYDGELVADERPVQRVTIKERLITVLLAHPDGMTASQLLEFLRSAGLPNMSRQNLAPKLTRLKAEKTLERAYGLWKLKKHEIEEYAYRAPLLHKKEFP